MSEVCYPYARHMPRKPRMELRHLRYFVAIAEAGSFTRAAARLGMEQPPLSQQLQAPQRGIGVRPLRRPPRGGEPTPAGPPVLGGGRAGPPPAEAPSERAPPGAD